MGLAGLTSWVNHDITPAAAPGAETAASPATGSSPVPRGAGSAKPGNEAPGLLDDLVGTQDLADLMEARHTPATHGELASQEKPGRPLHDDRLPDRRSRLEPSPARGLGSVAAPRVPRCRAALATRTIKERLGRLKIHHRRHTPFYEGIGAILSDVSATTCIYCGRPGRMRRPGWMDPACDQCWTLEQRNPELVNPNREPIEDLVRAPAGPARS